LDYTKDGVSFELAKTLGLGDIKFLQQHEGNQFKVAVFAPQNDIDKIADAVFMAGGGIIGEYSNCSFRSNGQGTFLGSEKSNPAIGKKNNFEKVDETRLEFIVDAWKLNKVISAIKKTHPYEEPAYDIFAIKNKNINYGAGAFGKLEKTLNENEFLLYVSNRLKTKTLHYCQGQKKQIKNIAVCGGAGSDLVNIAISSGADAFITADIKYHTFQDALGKIVLIDAGHYETEVIILDIVKSKIEKQISPKDK
jgi:hypothetical protein